MSADNKVTSIARAKVLAFVSGTLGASMGALIIHFTYAETKPSRVKGLTLKPSSSQDLMNDVSCLALTGANLAEY